MIINTWQSFLTLPTGQYTASIKLQYVCKVFLCVPTGGRCLAVVGAEWQSRRRSRTEAATPPCSSAAPQEGWSWWELHCRRTDTNTWNTANTQPSLNNLDRCTALNGWVCSCFKIFIRWLQLLFLSAMIIVYFIPKLYVIIAALCLHTLWVKYYHNEQASLERGGIKAKSHTWAWQRWGVSGWGFPGCGGPERSSSDGRRRGWTLWEQRH